MPSRSIRRLAVLAALPLALGVMACDDDGPAGPGAGPDGEELAVVLNSIDLSLTVFPVDSPALTRAIGLAPAGSPVSLAIRDGHALVPLGFLSAVAVVDLGTDDGDVRTIPLPDNSGATGVAFWNATTAYVANPNLDSVSRIDLTEDTADVEIDVGGFPQAVIASADRVWVLNAELDENFQPARPGLISIVDPASNTVIDSIHLSGLNPAAGAFGPDGLLYIVNSGRFGQGDGSLSVVDPMSAEEIEHHTGFGEFPGALVIRDDGHVFVGSFSFGIAIWDAAADSFIRPPSDPLILNGISTSSGIAFDSQGRLYSLVPGDCTAPSVALRANADLSFDREIPVGVCPIAVKITDLPLPFPAGSP